MSNKMILEIPGTKSSISPDDKVKLGRFSDKEWVVNFGWYSFGGNRPVCGWYLTSDAGYTVKPLQLPDLDDIYLIL